MAHHPTCCSKCGFRTTPSAYSGRRGGKTGRLAERVIQFPGADVVATTNTRRRALIRVVDELGSSELCDVCVLILIADLGGSGDVTVFVARPNVTASPTTTRKDTR